MSILDAAVHVGVETTYGTPVTPTRSFEAKADSFKREQAQIESVGFRASMHTVRSDRRRQINMGGSGTLELDVLNKGMGLLLQGLLSSTTGPTLVGTSAYTQQHDSGSTLSGKSFTIQFVRDVVDGSTQAFTHHGCVATGWSISQGTDGFLEMSIDFDFEDVDTATAAATPAYPASATGFDWTQAVVTLNSVAFADARSFELTADLGVKTDRRYLRGSALKKQPRRSGVPSYTGTIEADFTSTTEYDAFVAGTVMPLNVKWSHAANAIETGHTFEFEVDIAAIQFDGESPEASLSDITTQRLPFKVLHDGTNPAVSLKVKSTDSSL
ncbi:MAG: hypothetical protein D6683_01360 [Actinomyces sp.]|nr:MAG: hypothetical protein D6683_01360 [Actinomyces sp.]